MPRALIALIGWTLFVWVSRIRNIVGDDDLATAGRAGRLVIALAFIAVAVLVAVLAGRGSRRLTSVLAGFVVATVGFWAVRGVEIVLDDHPAGFVAVHSALAVVSIVLAVACWPGRVFAGAGPR